MAGLFMQFGQPGDVQTIDTWSDAEVDQALSHLETIEQKQHNIELLLSVHQSLLVAMLVIVVALFAWHAIGPFIPTSRQLIGKD
jgi:hypothetical protein